jgi:PAS domain S-box-containing protein
MTPAARHPLNVLLLEDRSADAELIVHELKRAGFEPAWRRVEDELTYLHALESPPDLILADFNMPALSAERALELARKTHPDVPFIVVSGSIGEEIAVQLLKSGATDYLIKDRLGRLGEAVRRAVSDRQLAQSKREADALIEVTEARSRFALEASHIGTWECDFATGVAHWSDTLEVLHGMPRGTFGGTIEAFHQCILPEDRAAVEAGIADAIREHIDSHVIYRTMWPDGTVHWISRVGRTIYDEVGRATRAAGIGLDVTERRVLEERSRQAHKMEAIGQLAGGVAHDFNNLLTAIHGYSILIAEELPPDSPLLDDVQQIRHSADRATSLTRQLLAFSRRQILDPHVLDLRESVKSIEPMLRRLIGEDITFTVRAAAAVGRIKADPGQIEQVVMNLALNARDAMPRGGTLLIDVADVMMEKSAGNGQLPSGPCVRLAVSDTGDGMTPETQARIFEPFFTTKLLGQGTGLGLSTVYGIVTQSGGHVVVDSVVGRGTTFSVYLPRVDDPAELVVAPQAPASTRGTETILVVEDEEAVRDLVQKALRRYGYEVLVAATPREALEIASRAGRIHLLISDMVLPQMSGREMAGRMLQIQHGMHVLYMSGYTDHAILDGGILERGMSFLQKPFTPPALAHKVREVLG